MGVGTRWNSAEIFINISAGYLLLIINLKGILYYVKYICFTNNYNTAGKMNSLKGVILYYNGTKISSRNDSRESNLYITIFYVCVYKPVLHK